MQLTKNEESRRLQYELAARARALGFRDVEVIDEDLGRSGSGIEERPGFQRLVSTLCKGDVGAVVAFDASRLARNGKDWHHLLELCALVGALVIDHVGVYDPRHIDDRLLLGLKGSMSELELSLLRQRSKTAIDSMAKRGELRFALPVGYEWTEDNRLVLDPDRRVQAMIRLIFKKFRALGSVRQVHLWLRGEKIEVPTRSFAVGSRETSWRLPVYNTILAFIKNPIYAGAYAYGKTLSRTRLNASGSPSQTRGHMKPREQWSVLIRDHHPGYITWDDHERNLEILAENAHMKQGGRRKSGRGGRALLAGLLRCRRCGRMLHVAYTGSGKRAAIRYSCRGAHINHGEKTCISFGGHRVDVGLARELLEVVDPLAIKASARAIELRAEEQEQQKDALALALEQARYEVGLARRRYEQVDPDNRLVASELEARWNHSLERVVQLEQRIEQLAANSAREEPIDRAAFERLAEDLVTVWNSPAATMALKQRLVRVLLEEIVVDVDADASQIVMLIHWRGGRHSELRLRKNRPGRHRYSTSETTVSIVEKLATRLSDDKIASVLNRMGIRTGKGNTWNLSRVASLRGRRKIPAFNPATRDPSVLNLAEAAEALSVSASTVRRLIESNILTATQITRCAPWEIQREALATDAVQQAVKQAKTRGIGPRSKSRDSKTLTIPGT